ncbi:MAG: hypothetical protein CMH54_05460 [Myxococcales bacterium]|nr:hypothetical protein [Myxococcales bacterium]
MNDLERRVRQLLDPYTGTGLSSRELLQNVYRRLVDRLFFGDFHVTEHTQLIGGREIAQIVATKAGRVIGPGLLCCTRLDDPGRLEHALPWNDQANLDKNVWSLLVYLTQMDVLASTSVDRFVRPVSLLLTSGPSWFQHEAVFDTLTKNAATPQCALVSYPTRGAVASGHKGEISVRLRPTDELKARLRPRLAGQNVERAHTKEVETDLLDPDGLFVKLLGSEDVSLHDMTLSGGTASVVLASDGLGEKMPWQWAPVPDGTPIGCDVRELLLILSRHIVSLEKASLDGRVVSIDSSDEIVAIDLAIGFTNSPEEAMETIVEIVSDDTMFHVALEGVVPQLTPTTGGLLHQCLNALETETTDVQPTPTEAGVFAAQNIESFITGPGSMMPGGTVTVNTTQLDGYGQLFEELVDNLALNDPRSV